jgi:hypothetical protein
MLYQLYEWDYDVLILHGVWEGPDGLDLEALQDQFNARLDHRTLGRPREVPSTGPTAPYQPGHLFSGSIAIGAPMAVQSPELEAWQKEHRAAQQEWYDKRAIAVQALREQYPGGNELLMFVSYLEKEHGFKRLESQEYRLG